MKTLVTFLAVMLMISSMASAATVYTVSPTDLSANLSTGFGWDTDMAAPVGVSSTGSVGGNSFWSNVTGVAPNKYAAFRFTPQAVGFGTGATTNDITSFTYDTKFVSGGTPNYDWRVNIYTAKQAGQTSGWYGSRISYKWGETLHDWTTTDLFALGVDSVLNRVTNVQTYSYQTGFTSALDAAKAQSIMFIDIIAGANSPNPAVDAYLDNIHMTGTGGVDAQVNLVPEPATMCLLGLGGLLFARKKK